MRRRAGDDEWVCASYVHLVFQFRLLEATEYSFSGELRGERFYEESSHSGGSFVAGVGDPGSGGPSTTGERSLRRIQTGWRWRVLAGSWRRGAIISCFGVCAAGRGKQWGVEF